MKRSATERAKDTPCASWHVSAFGVVGFHVPRGSAAGMCLFLFPAANREHVTGKEKFFSYGACNLATGSLYYRQLPPGEMGSEDFDVFFGMILRKHGNFYNISRSKACQCAYLRILACLCFWCCGLPCASRISGRDVPFLFPAAKQATCNRKGKVFFVRRLQSRNWKSILSSAPSRRNGIGGF